MNVLIVSEGVSELGGSLQVLIERLISRKIDATTLKISDPNLRADHGGQGPRYFKKAIRCIRYAEKLGFDAVVVVIDQDDQPDRRKQFADAQSHQLTPLPRALGVAVRKFDAWMLTDEKALTEVLGTQISAQQNPEEMKDPKRIFGDLSNQASFSEGMAAAYARIASRTDLILLEKRCPSGFKTFADRARTLTTA
jgi:hypothetical protein